jgi:hypothetical protein
LSDDIDPDDWRGDLLWAIEDEQLDQVAILAPGHDLDFVDETSGFTPLMLAVDSSADGANQQEERPDLAVVQTLLACGASPTVQGRTGENATDIARQYHWHEAIDAMHAADPIGVPRLFWPLGYVDRIRRAGVEPDDDTPWRAELMDAIKRTDASRVRALLAGQEGTLDFIHPGSSLTPLQLAIGEQRRSHRDHRPRDTTVVRLLLAAGAAPDFPPDVWSSPLSSAEGWPEATELLRAAMDR